MNPRHDYLRRRPTSFRWRAPVREPGRDRGVTQRRHRVVERWGTPVASLRPNSRTQRLTIDNSNAANTNSPNANSRTCTIRPNPNHHKHPYSTNEHHNSLCKAGVIVTYLRPLTIERNATQLDFAVQRRKSGFRTTAGASRTASNRTKITLRGRCCISRLSPAASPFEHLTTTVKTLVPHRTRHDRPRLLDPFATTKARPCHKNVTHSP